MELCVSDIFRAIAAAVPERTAIVHRDKRISYAELDERTDRLANLFLSKGIGLRSERKELEDWQSGQDHIAIYMRNRPEYLEVLLGAMKARATGFNVNFRFTHSELAYLLNNARASTIVFESIFAEQIDALVQARNDDDSYKLLLQIGDQSDLGVSGKAKHYETEIITSAATLPDTSPSPDDIFLLFTGGTTGMPKGVLWRQADVITTLIGTKLDSIDALTHRAVERPVQRFLLLPPFMHGTAQWNAMSALFGGNEIHIQHNTDSLQPEEILSQIERESINVISMVGDAFGRPICEALRAGSYDISSLKHVLNSGAILSPEVKAELLDAAPLASIVDTIGASESGPQAKKITAKDELACLKSSSHETKFRAGPTTVVVDESRSKLLAPGHDGEGWLAKRTTIPFGYLDDREKTRATFIKIDGVRYSVPGDRVRLLGDGAIEFCGREATTINSGGEKIFAEEVEAAIRMTPAVEDVIVSSRPSDRWGNEVVAIVQTRAGRTVTDEDVLNECAKHLARFKLPKAIVYVDQVKRGDNGKADIKWAKNLAKATAK